MPPDTFSSSRVILRMLTGAVMISFSGVWVELADVSPEVSAFYRVFFGTIFLLPAVLWRRELRKRRRFHLPAGFACGTAFALDLLFYHKSILLIGPGLGTIIPNFQVFILSLIGFFFLGETLRLKFVIAVPLAFAGLFMVVGIDWSQLDRLYHTGVYYGFAAAACYAAFILALRRLQAAEAGGSTFYILMLVSLTTTVILAVFVVGTGHSFIIPDSKSLAALLILAFFSQAVGWILITGSLPKIRMSSAGLILLLQPSLAFVWDVVFFHRPMSLLNRAGVIVTVTAIYLGLTAGSAEEKSRNPKTGNPVSRAP